MVSSRTRLALLLAATAAVAATMPWPASAQDPAIRAEARASFEEGITLAEADRWAEALAAFRRSASLVPRPSTSYNIANALYRLDRPVEALAELDEYDRMPEVRSDPAARNRGATLRTFIRDAVGEIRLTVTPGYAKLFVDGRPSVLEGRERSLFLDPGSHSIRVTLEGYEPHHQELRVERGSRQAHTIELDPQPAPAAIAAAPSLSVSSSTLAVSSDEVPLSTPEPTQDDRKRFVKRPGFWVMIGVIAAAGIGAGVAVALLRKDDAPSCGTTGDCATTQGLTVSSF
jgi:hypothetical protein